MRSRLCPTLLGELSGQRLTLSVNVLPRYRWPTRRPRFKRTLSIRPLAARFIRDQATIHQAHRGVSLDVRLQEASASRLSHAEFLELILQDELAVRHAGDALDGGAGELQRRFHAFESRNVFRRTIH